MDALGADGLNLEDLQGGAVVEDVQRGAGAQRRAGLGQDIGDALVVDALGGVLELLDGGDLLHARQRGGLEEVRGGHRGARQDLGAQGVVHLEGAPELLALADEDRVEHHGGEVVGLQGLLNDVDGGRRAQHADLDGVDARVDGGAGLDLVGDDAGVHGDEAVVPPVLGVHGHDAGQGRATVDAEGVEGLEVGLGAGAARGLGAGDGQGDGRGCCCHGPSLRPDRGRWPSGRTACLSSGERAAVPGTFGTRLILSDAVAPWVLHQPSTSAGERARNLTGACYLTPSLLW